MSRRLVLVVTVFLSVCLGTTTAAQAAGGGHKTPIELDYTTVSQDLCGFPVTIQGHLEGFSVSVEKRHGSVQNYHFTETDVFSANGNSLTSTSYMFNNHFRLDDQGNVLSATQTGVIVRIPLPNGKTFMVAGRADFLNLEGDFVSIPTNGVSKNREAFCAALSE
jgi:hypothetical protein